MTWTTVVQRRLLWNLIPVLFAHVFEVLLAKEADNISVTWTSHTRGTTANVKWGKVSDERGKVIRYRIWYSETGHAPLIDISTSGSWESAGSQALRLVIPRLYPLTKYSFVVAAVTAAGTGDLSKPFTSVSPDIGKLGQLERKPIVLKSISCPNVKNSVPNLSRCLG